MPLRFNISWHHLQTRLPNSLWRTMFGPAQAAASALRTFRAAVWSPESTAVWQARLRPILTLFAYHRIIIVSLRQTSAKHFSWFQQGGRGTTTQFCCGARGQLFENFCMAAGWSWCRRYLIAQQDPQKTCTRRALHCIFCLDRWPQVSIERSQKRVKGLTFWIDKL